MKDWSCGGHMYKLLRSHVGRADCTFPDWLSPQLFHCHSGFQHWWYQPQLLASCWEGSYCPISAHHPSPVPCPERQRKMSIAPSLSTRMWVSFVQAPPISVYAFWYLLLLPTLIPAIVLPFYWFSVTLSLLSQSNLVFWSRWSGSAGMNSVVNCKHPWGTKRLLCHHFR